MIIANKEIVVDGKLLKIAKLKGEYHEWLDDPCGFVDEMKRQRTGADVFTFIQSITDRTPRFQFYHEWESVAAVPISTYDTWFKKQINDKTRNMIRRAQKSGVEVRLVPFNDDLVKGIKNIYDETPVRQGKPFKHYGKSLETLKESHITFLEKSDFLGAYYQDELIGFVKLVREGKASDMMHIISMVGHREKAPTNALIAKAVELCAERGDCYLQYGPWSGRTLIDFKKHHAFERVDLPRYFVPLNLTGKVMLKLKLHRKMTSVLPEKWRYALINVRNRFNEARLARE